MLIINFFLNNKKEILNRLLIVGFLLLPLFFIFYPLLFQRKIFSSSFIFDGMYPLFYHYSNILKCCNYIPTWSSSYLNGFPVILTQGFGFLHPFSIIFFKFFDYILAYNWLVVISGFLTSFFTYLLARELNLSKPASLIAGVIFLFNGLVIQWLPLLAFAYFLPIYPLVFLLILKIYRNKNKSQISYWYISLLILIITIGWVSAFTEVIFYLVLAVIAFSLFVDFKNFKKNGEAKESFPLLKKFKTTKQLFVALVISSMFASIWILPVYQFSKMSPRSGGLSLEEAYRGSSNWGDYFAIFNFNTSLGGSASSIFYIGVFSLFLVIFSLFYFRTNKFIKFFWVLFLLVFAIMMPHSPILWFIHRIPPFSWFRGGFKYFFLGHLSLAILAGFGLDAMKKLKGNVVWDNLLFYLSRGFIAVIIGLLSFKFIFYQILNLLNNYFLNNKWHDKIWIFLDKSYRHSSFFDFYSIISLIFFVASFSLIYAYKNDKIDFRTLAIVVLFFITFNLSFFWKDYYNRYPLISDSYLRETTQLTAFLQKNKNEGGGAFRITRFYPGMEHYYKKIDYIDQYEFSRGTIAPNLNIIYDLDSINAFEEGLTTKRQARILEKIYSESISVGNSKDQFKSMNLEEKLRHFSSAFNVSLLSMMNVKYALSASKLNGEWKKIFESNEINQSIPIYIYENPKVFPRIYFANEVNFKTSEESAFAGLLTNKDFSGLIAIIECEHDCNSDKRETNKDVLNIIEKRNGYIKLKTNTKNGRWLIYSENYTPFGRAKINGSNSHIYIANYIYQAIFIPNGENTVEFYYPGLIEQYFDSLRLLLFH